MAHKRNGCRADFARRRAVPGGVRISSANAPDDSQSVFSRSNAFVRQIPCGDVFITRHIANTYSENCHPQNANSQRFFQEIPNETGLSRSSGCGLLPLGAHGQVQHTGGAHVAGATAASGIGASLTISSAPISMSQESAACAS
jgi:hypothetical protein